MWRPTTRKGRENRCGDRPRGTAGTGAPPAAFNLGLCRLRGILSPPVPACVRHDHSAGGPFICAGDNPCSDCQIDPLKSGIAAAMRLFPGIPCSDSQVYPMKSGITARRRANPGHSLQRLPSLTPEITNRCTHEGQSRAISAAIPKFTP